MHELTELQVLRDIEELKGDLSGRRAKYIRNYNRYVNNGQRRDAIDQIYNPPQAFWAMSAEADTGPIPIANTLRSIVQTQCSKLAQTKVRPFFNPINGTWETRRVARGMLQFFDLYFDSQHLYEKGIDCRRDAAVLDMGVLKINDESGNIEKINPWRFFFDRAEYAYRGETGLTRCFDESHHFPRRFFLPQYRAGIDWAKSVEADIDSEPIKKCEYVEYYDLAGQKKHFFIDGAKVAEKPIDFQVSPYVMLFQERPIKGAYSTSLIDDAWTLQTMIDMLMMQIELAVELTPAAFVLLPLDSEIKKSMWSNQIMAVYEYHPSPFIQAGPQIATPAPVNPLYLDLAKWFIDLVYNFTGISQLSAQSVKPAGLNSGVALQTVQDVESERFQTVLDDQINLYMRVTERVIDIFPSGIPLFRNHLGRARITWSDVRRERENLNIQFAPASALSKDPSTKMAEIEKLIAMKVIPPEMAPEYLEFPDLEKLEGKLSAVNDVIEYLIERAAEDGEFEYDSVIPGVILEQKVLSELYHLVAAGDATYAVDNLREFYKRVRSNNNALRAAAQPPPPPPQPAPFPGQPPMIEGPTNEIPAVAPSGPGVEAVPPAGPPNAAA